VDLRQSAFGAASGISGRFRFWDSLTATRTNVGHSALAKSISKVAFRVNANGSAEMSEVRRYSALRN
jgi:hypothetical protein